ncbi:MAG: glutaredoxin 3 [Caulobacterales bacterium 32-69-10]|nr:MAG: glutaredoxin 3 [Caulobacterales bacterium 32-69-10]
MASVEIYTRPFCGYCARALGLLTSKGVDFKEIDDASQDVNKKRDMVQRSNGRSTFPQIFIDGRHIGGCDDLLALDRSGELDKLLAA